MRKKLFAVSALTKFTRIGNGAPRENGAPKEDVSTPGLYNNNITIIRIDPDHVLLY